MTIFESAAFKAEGDAAHDPTNAGTMTGLQN
jgi:hypothetical protein